MACHADLIAGNVHISFGLHGTAAAGEKEMQEARSGANEARVITCAQNFATTDDDGRDDIRANQIPMGTLSVLAKLGEVIKNSIRKTDSGYRYGGEEFTVRFSRRRWARMPW